MSAKQATDKADTVETTSQEALRLAEWLAGVEEEMLRLLLPGSLPIHTTLAGIVHKRLEQGDIAGARAKAAHLPHVNRELSEERREEILQRLGPVMLANFNSMAAAYVRLHQLLETRPPSWL